MRDTENSAGYVINILWRKLPVFLGLLFLLRHFLSKYLDTNEQHLNQHLVIIRWLLNPELRRE